MSMTEDELMKELAGPIIEKLKEVDKEMGDQNMSEVPQVHFVRNHLQLPTEIDGFEITDEFLEKLEQYIQDELESFHKPSVLH
ncbi:hypothetical protein [Absicoccus porci]|jgi:hypothetical protein|uniref:Uncharacterized protein n=2 Tax=Absicoccus porci TaxID=2486576 RepID=A0A3N0I454_9FIRM|nr:hypothetical protein [Absicoccus porci]MDD6459902.1 hypothetical protein [Absicoccus porci]RNM31784.1 hypothetical protein EDX97_04320 [Absicoccus porci]